MIQHIVLVKFRADVTGDQVQSIWDELASLTAVIDGMENATFGANISPEGLSRGFTHGFTMSFPDAATRDAYLNHPAHKAAGARLVAALDGGLDGLLVVDI